MKTRLVAALLASLCGTAALAQSASVWRCGPDGRLYSDRPCADVGQPVTVADPRNAAEQAEGRAVAEREAALADQLRAERLEREMGSAAMVAINTQPIDWNSPTVAERAFGRRSGPWHKDVKRKWYPQAGQDFASPYDLSETIQNRPRRYPSVRPASKSAGRGG